MGKKSLWKSRDGYAGRCKLQTAAEAAMQFASKVEPVTVEFIRKSGAFRETIYFATDGTEAAKTGRSVFLESELNIIVELRALIPLLPANGRTIFIL